MSQELPLRGSRKTLWAAVHVGDAAGLGLGLDALPASIMEKALYKKVQPTGPLAGGSRWPNPTPNLNPNSPAGGPGWPAPPGAA